MIQHIITSPALLNYIRQVSLREDPILKELREETSLLPNAHIQILPEQGQLLSLLIKAIKANKALEIGVFTGYSSLCIASALPKDGILTACDNNAEWTAIARRFWQKAEVAAKIDLHVQDALQTLEQLLQTAAETYDFIFIDADKLNYQKYYEHSLKLLKPGGLIVIDNTLWSGRVNDPAVSDDQTVAIRKLNNFLLNDARVDISLMPYADGVTLVYKRVVE